MQVSLEVAGRVRWHGSPVAGDRPAALLRALVDAGPAGARAETLIGAIWGDTPPADPRKALQVLVSRTRAATDPRVIGAVAHGYRIGLERAEIDVTAAADLAARAAELLTAGAAAEALDTADRALALDDVPAARRTAALARARLGDHAAALPALRELLVATPWDEQVVAAALRAEAGVSGPAAALESYERYRTAAADRLGTGPGPEVGRAYRELLGADRPVRVGLDRTAAALIGRDEAVAEVTALLATSRLVSIVGTGGLGKTSLAHRVAAEDRAGAVYFVELAPITATTAAQLLPALAAVLEIRDRLTGRAAHGPVAPDRLRTRIAERLAHSPTLLVLDNCEHVAGAAAALIAGLLAEVADLRVLTTSRTPLGLAVEQVHPLAPLADGPAADLLARRARARRPSVVLDPGEIAALVDLLDGLPLAIELAAAQARVLSIAQITAAMTDRFALLTDTDRSAPPRHRTLAAVIDWSYRLLTASAREALPALALFTDGFTADHARNLLAAAGVAGADAGPVPAPVTELVDQSLLVVEERGGVVRYRMLATVAEYAAGLARKGGRTDLLRAAHTRWARELARCAGPRLFGDGPVATAVAAVRGAKADLRAVFERACRAGDAATALEVAGALGPAWFLSGHRVRLFGLVAPVEQVLTGWEPEPETAPAVRLPVAVLALFGAMSPLRTRLPETRRVLGLLGTHPAGTAFAAAVAAVAAALLAAAPGDESDRLAALVAGADRPTAMLAGMLLAGEQENAGRPGAALATARAVLARIGPDDGPWPGTFLRMLLAQLHCQLGDFAAAELHAESAIPLLEALGAHADVAQCRVVTAIAALDAGRLGRAETELAAARRIVADENTSAAMTADLVGAEIALGRGDHAGAASLIDRALARPTAGARTGLFGDGDTDPWVLLAESVALALCTEIPAAAATADRLAARLTDRLSRALRPGRNRYDFPVLGGALFCLGIEAARRPDADAAHAATLFALAEACAYNRFLPALAWARTAVLLGDTGRAELARARAALAGAGGAELLARAAAAVAQRSR